MFKVNFYEEYSLSQNLHYSLLKATEEAAIASYLLFGAGDEKLADKAAVDAMRRALNDVEIDGTIVIGEGERDEAPMLYIGEQVGLGRGDMIDIAVDPLEGTTILATGSNNSLSVLAAAPRGCILNAPDVYMAKIAIGFDFPEQLIDIDESPKENINNVAKALKKRPEDVVVMVLDRPRHQDIISQIRSAGARVALIKDGDISAVISTSSSKTNIDMYLGVGGAPEGVLAAAALKTLGGQISTRLIFRTEEEKNRAFSHGIKDLDKKYNLDDLANGDVIFIATGVTDGTFLSGVKFSKNVISTNSMILRSSMKLTSFIENHRVLNNG